MTPYRYNYYYTHKNKGGQMAVTGAKELAVLIGKTITISIEKLNIEVNVNDARSHFGRTEVLVNPVSGSGEQWIDIKRRVK